MFQNTAKSNCLTGFEFSCSFLPFLHHFYNTSKMGKIKPILKEWANTNEEGTETKHSGA